MADNGEESPGAEASEYTPVTTSESSASIPGPSLHPIVDDEQPPPPDGQAVLDADVDAEPERPPLMTPEDIEAIRNAVLRRVEPPAARPPPNSPTRHVHFAPPHRHTHSHSHAHSHAPPPMQHPQLRPIQAHRQRTIRVPPAQAMPQANQPSNQLGAVRDRLFQAMLVRMALWYTARVNRTWRRVIEFVAISLAIASFLSLAIIHGMFMRVSTTCLTDIESTWPRDGIIRVELVRNLAMLRKKEEQYREYRVLQAEEMSRQPPPVCRFSTKEVLMRGPAVLPAEIREFGYLARPSSSSSSKERSIFGTVIGYIYPDFFELDAPVEEEGFEPLSHEDEEDWAAIFDNEFNSFYEPDQLPYFEYRVEYSLIYGLLRLPRKFIDSHNISVLVKQIDSDDACLGTPSARWLMANLVGFDDPILHTLKALAINESDIGYVHDLRSNDHYHFVQLATTKMSYVTACIVMMLFTFAISLLLRFSHHQIFLFIVDLLHMFEHNQPLSFPAAPLLTVILALVGMEAIMSEVFNDTTTAFYVILIVWLADQFDAICCQSPTSKRYWLRFFFLHQFFFYSYQYRFGGIYGGLALLTSSLFILHSMIFFFHHYEIPLILYTDRLQRIMGELNGREPPIVQEVNLATGPGDGGEGAAPPAPPPPPPPPSPPQVNAEGVRRVNLPGVGPQREMIGIPLNAPGESFDNDIESRLVAAAQRHLRETEQRTGADSWIMRMYRMTGGFANRMLGGQPQQQMRQGIDQGVPGNGPRLRFHLNTPNEAQRARILREIIPPAVAEPVWQDEQMEA